MVLLCAGNQRCIRDQGEIADGALVALGREVESATEVIEPASS